MATNTTNYNLVKPALNETADIEVINSNMDIIDNELNNSANEISIISGEVTSVSGSVTGLQNEVSSHLSETTQYSTYKLNIDSNGIYTEVHHKRADGTLILKSILSGGTSPQYTTRIETKYLANGITVEWTKVYTVTYNSDGNVVSEVMN